MTPPVSLAILPSIQKTAFLASYEIRQNAAHLFSSEVVGSSCDPTHPMGRIGTALAETIRIIIGLSSWIILVISKNDKEGVFKN